MVITNEQVKFVDRVAKLLERVEYRRADSLEDKTAIFRMRHEAYTRDGTVERRPNGLFDDEFDGMPNAWLIGVFVDGDLAGSLRLHVSAHSRTLLPAVLAFPDIVNAHLRERRVMIDGSRMVTKLEYSKRYSELPYITLRPTFLATSFFDADYMTAACRVEHQAFYKRVCAGVPWCEPRRYPNFNRLMALVGSDCRATRSQIYERYPFFQSTLMEQQRIFGSSSNASGNIMKAIGRDVAVELSAV